MTHRDAWERLDLFLDGALGAEARWQVTAHLDECPICRAHVAAQARLRGIVRERITSVEPPPGLSTRLASALAAETKAPISVIPNARPPHSMRLVAFVGPALAALLLVIAFVLPAVRADGDLTQELVATHTLFAHDESMLDVAGDAATITTWFRDATGLQVSTPQLTGYTLVGGRLITVNGRPVAQLVYEGQPEENYLSLLRFQRSNPNPVHLPLGDDIALSQEGPTSLATWVSGEERVALIGMVPSDELRHLAEGLAGNSSALPAAMA